VDGVSKVQDQVDWKRAGCCSLRLEMTHLLRRPRVPMTAVPEGIKITIPFIHSAAPHSGPRASRGVPG
jgi:hypothetical protein